MASGHIAGVLREISASDSVVYVVGTSTWGSKEQRFPEPEVQWFELTGSSTGGVEYPARMDGERAWVPFLPGDGSAEEEAGSVRRARVNLRRLPCHFTQRLFHRRAPHGEHNAGVLNNAVCRLRYRSMAEQAFTVETAF